MNTTINIYVESNGPRNIGTDEVLIYGSHLGDRGPTGYSSSTQSSLFGAGGSLSMRHPSMASRPLRQPLVTFKTLRNTIADLECQIERARW